MSLKKFIKEFTPRRLKDIYIWDYKKRLFDIENGYATISYSQQCEDLTLKRLFGDKKEGFYVDVGAFDPVLYSNTNIFYKEGWEGINIEPNVEQLNVFKKIRTRDINLNLAVSCSKKEMDYYKFNAPALNTFSKENAKIWDSKPGFSITEIIKVQSLPLGEILEAYSINCEIDFFSIDVEGMDLEVLKSNEWEKYSPKAIVVEQELELKKPVNEHSIYKFLNQLGYELWSITGGSWVYYLPEKFNFI